MHMPSAPSHHFVPTTLYPAAAPTPFQIACRVQGRVSERGEFCLRGNIDVVLLRSNELHQDQNFPGSSWCWIWKQTCCCSLVSLATKFVFFHCLSSEILLEVQQENLKFKMRSWEPTRLGSLGLKPFHSIIGERWVPIFCLGPLRCHVFHWSFLPRNYYRAGWDKSSTDLVLEQRIHIMGFVLAVLVLTAVIRSIYSCSRGVSSPGPGGHNTVNHIYGHEVRTGLHSVPLSGMMKSIGSPPCN